MNIDVGEPVWRELPEPRRLTGGELAVLAVLVEALDHEAVRAQLAGAVVCGVCRCGCSAVRLVSDAPPVPTSVIRRFTGGRRDDYLAVTAEGTNVHGETVQLVLHLVDGRMEELEIFVGEGIQVVLGDDTVRNIVVSTSS